MKSKKFRYGRFVTDSDDVRLALAEISVFYSRCFADKPGVRMWDIQEDQPVLEVAPRYSNAICLGWPIHELEDFLNLCSNTALKSEGIPPTRPAILKPKLEQLDKFFS